MNSNVSPWLSFYDPVLPRMCPPPEPASPRSPPLRLALTTCLTLSVGENLTADPRHAGNGVGNDRSCGEGAQDLGLSPKGGSTDLWVEEEPCSEATGRERAQGRGKRAEGTGAGVGGNRCWADMSVGCKPKSTY